MTDLAGFGRCTLDDDGCTTCGDVGVPVRVVDVSDGATAVCEDRTGARAEIRVDYTPGVQAGDVLLVHMGISIARMTQTAA